MSDKAEQLLHKLIKDIGIDAINTPKRIESLLKDHAQGQYKREINLWMLVLREGIVQELQNNQVSIELTNTRSIKKLHDECGTDIQAAQWAIESWIEVLGLQVNKNISGQKETAVLHSKKTDSSPEFNNSYQPISDSSKEQVNKQTQIANSHKQNPEPSPVFKLIKTINPGTFWREPLEFRRFDMSSDGQFIAAFAKRVTQSGASSAILNIFDINQEREIAILKRPFERWLDFSPGNEEALFSPAGISANIFPHMLLAHLDNRDDKSIHIYQSPFKKKKKIISLKFKDDRDRHHGASSWSPDGQYFGSGSFRHHNFRYKDTDNVTDEFTIWDVSNGKIISSLPVYLGTAHSCNRGKSSWSPDSKYVLVDGTLIDLTEHKVIKMEISLIGLDDKSLAWHPTQAIFAFADLSEFILFDANTRRIIARFNDIEESNVEISQIPLSDREHCYTKTITFSPDGSLLASADLCGNVVIRNTKDMSIINTYYIGMFRSGSYLKWLPHRESGLIMAAADKKLNTYYVDPRCDLSPIKLPKILGYGGGVWSNTNRVAVMNQSEIRIYEHS